MFKDVLKYAPEKAYLDEEGNLRIYDEMWLADWWWEIQVSNVVFGISREDWRTNLWLLGKITHWFNRCTNHSLLRQNTTFQLPRR